MNVTNLFCCCFHFYSECNRIWEAALTGIVRYCWTSELMLLGSIVTITEADLSFYTVMYIQVNWIIENVLSLVDLMEVDLNESLQYFV